MKEFITRTITAAFLIVAAYGLIEYVPLLYFSILLYLLISVAAMELVKLAQPRTASHLIIFLNGLVIACSFTFGKPDLMLAIIVILVVLIVPFGLGF